MALRECEADFEAACGDFLGKKRGEWDSQRQPYPRFLTAHEAERPPRIDPARTKMLFLIPQYIMNSKRFSEADFKDHFLDSAANAGASVEAPPALRASARRRALFGASTIRQRTSGRNSSRRPTPIPHRRALLSRSEIRLRAMKSTWYNPRPFVGLIAFLRSKKSFLGAEGDAVGRWPHERFRVCKSRGL